jgi:hypothetical protein
MLLMKHSIFNGKGQAAVEFLVTYGWAIMAVLVVLGALMYFGFFDTVKLADERCDFGDQLRCEDYRLNSDGWVALRLRNNLGVPIKITKFTFSSDYGNILCDDTATREIFVWSDPEQADTIGSTPYQTIQPGKQFEIDCDTAIDIGNDTLRIVGIVEFHKEGSSIYHNVTGDIYVTSQPAGSCSDGVRNCHGVGGWSGCEYGPDCWGVSPCQPALCTW